jgi:hypothetical protein
VVGAAAAADAARRTNDAKCGSSRPSWKISVVSMPPSVMNVASESCGRPIA